MEDKFLHLGFLVLFEGFYIANKSIFVNICKTKMCVAIAFGMTNFSHAKEPLCRLLVADVIYVRLSSHIVLFTTCTLLFMLPLIFSFILDQHIHWGISMIYAGLLVM